MAGTPTTSQKKKRDHERQKQRQRDAMRKLRELRRNNPQTYEEDKKKERERYYARKRAGKIKTIAEMTKREQRTKRKEWRNSSNTYYNRKKEAQTLERRLRYDTPPTTPTPEYFYEENQQDHNEILDGRNRQGKARRRRHTRVLKNKIKKLECDLHKEKSKKHKYRIRLKRLKAKVYRNRNENSPNEKIEQLIGDQNVSQEIKEKLVFSEVIVKQLSENYKQLKKSKEKRKFWGCISGNVMKKYKKKTYLKMVTTSFLKDLPQNNNKRKVACILLKNQITEFLEQDECSRLCPGKRDFIKKGVVKKQKRLLNDTLQHLHRKFITSGNASISYATFCKLKPFWIVHPKVNERDTCLCQMHTNMVLLVRKLNAVGMIKERTPQELLKSLCCDGELKEQCLARSCDQCVNKSLTLSSDTIATDSITYEKWTSKKIIFTVKGEQKSSVRTIKEKQMSTKGTIFSILLESLKPFFQHVRNIYHQYDAIKKIKNNMSIDEALVHMDFSENYTCKYAEEIQSAHFGGSKPQLSLHTVVVYYKNELNNITKQCYCTVSENLRHDAIAICAHLIPIFKEITENVNLKTIHFLSDGPSTQYRNRKMFHLVANYISNHLKVETVHWHYSEKGHGKGAPDGVGGVIKRTADGLVARGVDIPNLDTFMAKLNLICENVKLFRLGLEEKVIKSIEKYIPEPLPPYKGILRCHEVVWTRGNSVLDIRELSCLDCLPICTHYSLGPYPYTEYQHQIKVEVKRKLRYEDIYSSSDDELPLAHLTKKKKMIGDVSNSVASCKENVAPQSVPDLECDAKENDFVVVKFVGKKNSLKHYFGIIQPIETEYQNDFLVRFLRKIDHTEKFVFPSQDDISLINKKDVVAVLPTPTINNREQYQFSIDLSLFQKLN